jgi:hypothetical protein
VQNVLLPALDERIVSVPHIGTVEAVEGFQVGMALVDPSLAVPGTLLQVFAMSEKDRVPPGKSLLELGPGDRVVLTREAVVLTRFAVRDPLSGKLTYDATKAP